MTGAYMSLFLQMAKLNISERLNIEYKVVIIFSEYHDKNKIIIYLVSTIIYSLCLMNATL